MNKVLRLAGLFLLIGVSICHVIDFAYFDELQIESIHLVLILMLYFVALWRLISLRLRKLILLNVLVNLFVIGTTGFTLLLVGIMSWGHAFMGGSPPIILEVIFVLGSLLMFCAFLEMIFSAMYNRDSSRQMDEG